MTPSGNNERPTGAHPGEPGVLSNLPNTRPQRPSARRAAAKRAATDSVGNAPASDARRGAVKRAPGASGATAKSPAGAAAKPPASTRAKAPAGAATKRAARTAARRTAQPRSRPFEPPVPRQGFETESEIEPGAPVQPPSRPELAASVVELLGELAQSGLATGGRLLKDALGRLPGV